MIVRFAQYHTQGELTPACRHQLSERDGHSPFTLSRSFPTIQSHPTARCTIPWSPRYRKNPPRSRPRRLVEEWWPKHQYVALLFHLRLFNVVPQPSTCEREPTRSRNGLVKLNDSSDSCSTKRKLLNPPSSSSTRSTVLLPYGVANKIRSMRPSSARSSLSWTVWTDEVIASTQEGTPFAEKCSVIGQVIVIGATNRPDAIDPALRRPGRFDREFYFPLPDLVARHKILNIVTKSWAGWEGEKGEQTRGMLAKATKGYGGADLRVRNDILVNETFL